MASVRRFLPRKTTSNRRANRPYSTLTQELRKRKFRRRLFMPAAAMLLLFRRTACSMLAVASNSR